VIFWWTGKGYLALLTLIGVYGVFGAILTFAFGDQVLDRFPWLWSIGAALSAIVNWIVGCKVNKRILTPPRPQYIKSRLFYAAPNRFVSLPIETWSVPMLALSIFLLISGVLAHP
jgi:O-antigen/teichoic acid export membrane protein